MNRQTQCRVKAMYLFGGIGGGEVFFHLLLHRLADVVVCRILKVGLNLLGKDREMMGSFLMPSLILTY